MTETHLIDIREDFGGTWGLVKVERYGDTKIKTPIEDFEDYFYASEDKLDELYKNPITAKEITKVEHTTTPALFFNEDVMKVYVRGIWSKFKVRKEFRGRMDEIFECDVSSSMRYMVDRVPSFPKTKYKVLYFDIETSTDEGFPNWENAIEKITIINMYDNFSKEYYCYVLNPDEKHREDIIEGNKNTIFYKDEKEMIQDFMNRIKDEEYDVITAWNIAFDFSYLFGRCDKLKLNKYDFSPYNKVEIEQRTNKQGREEMFIKIDGIHVEDLLLRYKGVTFKEIPSYSLAYVSHLELGEDMEKGQVLDFTKEWKENLDEFIKYSYRDVEILVELDNKLHLIDYLEELRQISGAPNIFNASISKNLTTMAVLREYKDKMIMPSGDARERVKFGGGYLKVPVAGLYDWVTVYDFAGLYPSLMRTFNLSKESIRDFDNADFITHEDDIDTEKMERDGFKTGWSLKTKGIMPTILEKFLDTRAAIKKKMKLIDKDSIEYRDMNLRQYALKAPINANYGQNGYPGFFLYEPRVAATVTYLGRQLSQYCSRRVEEDHGLKNLYSDSVGKDSIIINEGNSGISVEELWNNIESRIIKRGTKEVKNCNFNTLTCNDKKKNIFSKCTQLIRHKVNKKMYRVYLTNETFIDVTEDHSLINYDKDLNFTEAKPQESNYLLLNRKIPRKEIKSKNLPKELYELLGMWIGDGGLHNSCLGISSGLDTDEFIEVVCKPLQDKGWVDNWSTDPPNYDMNIKSSKLRQWFRDNIKLGNSFTKEIPNWLYLETEENICSFLRGYFSADGSGLSGNLGIGSVNKKLLEQCLYLLNLCGISGRIGKDNCGNQYGPEGKITSYSYNLSVFYDSERFYKKIGFLFDRKNGESRTNNLIIPSKYDNRKYTHCNFISERIAKTMVPKKIFQEIQNYDILPRNILRIEEIGYDDYVYDLCVPETQKFYCNNILVHNTDSFFIEVKEDNEELLNQIEKDINEKYVPEFIHKIGNGKITKNYIKIENEKTFKKLLLIKKRRYLGHLTSGKWLFKGVDLKRSNTPEIIKDILQHYIDNLFEGKDETQTIQECFKMLEGEKDIDKFKVPLKISKVYVTNLPQKRAADWSNKYIKTSLKQGSKFYGIHVERPETDIVGFTQIDELKEFNIVPNMKKYREILKSKIENLKEETYKIKKIDIDFKQRRLF